MPMSKEEFKKKFEEFWWWVGGEKSCETSYWLSVEDFANMKFKEAKKREDAEVAANMKKENKA